MTPAYGSVIVDEVQDLTLVGVELLHAIAGEGPDRPLIIGDGQQSVYPGGFTLSEAGISVTGRASILRSNYRNTAEILEAAARLVADDSFDDLEDFDELGARDLEIARKGPAPIRVQARDKRSHDLALAQIIADTTKLFGVSNGDLAVLAMTTSRVKDCKALLARHRVPTVDLESYDGTSTDCVKVGAFRATPEGAGVQVRLPPLPHGRTVDPGGSKRPSQPIASEWSANVVG